MDQSPRVSTDIRHQTTALSRKARDFIILCPAVAENSGVLEALYALYYLPYSYKLMISATGAKNKTTYRRVCELIYKESLTDRVVLTEGAGVSETASPFSGANVVVYGNSDPIFAKETAQSIVVFDIVSKLSDAEGHHNFAVATNAPEALASAILTVARRQKRAAS